MVKHPVVCFYCPDSYRPSRQGVSAHIARGAPATSGTRVFYRGRTGISQFKIMININCAKASCDYMISWSIYII